MTKLIFRTTFGLYDSLVPNLGAACSVCLLFLLLDLRLPSLTVSVCITQLNYHGEVFFFFLFLLKIYIPNECKIGRLCVIISRYFFLFFFCLKNTVVVFFFFSIKYWKVATSTFKADSLRPGALFYVFISSLFNIIFFFLNEMLFGFLDYFP